MITSNKGIELIAEFEGFRSKPYLCPAGVPTIGYGTTVYPNSRKVSLKDTPITKEYAKELLFKNLEQYEKAVNQLVEVEITQNQFDALVSFTYNLGAGNLKKSTLLKLVNRKQFELAGFEFLKWNRAGGRILPGLVKRRNAEKEHFDA